MAADKDKVVDKDAHKLDTVAVDKYKVYLLSLSLH